MNLPKNWKTTTFGVIGGAAVTTTLAALASPEFMATLQAAGVNPLYLALIGGAVKVVRDIFAKDSNVTGGTEHQ